MRLRAKQEKFMKKFLKIAAVIVALILCCAMLFACAGGSVSGDSMTLVLTDGEDYTQVFQVDLNKMSYNENTGLMNILESMKLQGTLTYTATDSGYGAYLTQIGELTEDLAAHRSIYIYTSVEKDVDVSQYASTFTYEGKEYTNAGVGASQMTIEDDCVIIITYTTW